MTERLIYWEVWYCIGINYGPGRMVECISAVTWKEMRKSGHLPWAGRRACVQPLLYGVQNYIKP